MPPILLLLFNRPDNTQQLIDQLRKTRPDTLYVAVDGPRLNHSTDTENVASCIALLDTIDWPCQIHKRFAKKNLGCGNNVSGAITWFFSEVEEGIILEDDCLPSEAFFAYCQLLLPRYRNVPEVMMLSGNRWHDEFLIETDYFFSLFTSTWGWATWRRAWQQYDFTMSDWPTCRKDPAFAAWLRTPPIQTFWFNQLQRYYRHIQHEVDNWDFQWQYVVFKHHGLVVTPRQNLVQNIGVVGVHTHSVEEVHFKETAQTFTLTDEPTELSANYDHDTYHCEKLLANQPSKANRLLFGLKQVVSFNIPYIRSKVRKFLR